MKYQSVSTTEIIDKTTGEVLSIETNKKFVKKIENKEDFYISYIDFMSTFYKIKGDNPKNLLIWLCCHAEFNTGVIDLPAAKRKQLCEELNMHSNTLSNCLNKLKELNLIKGSGGQFQLNPQVFWRGESSVREEMLKGASFEVSFSLYPPKE